jgi:predicted transcriptional regulator
MEDSMKAIIALSHKGSIFGAVNQQVVNSRQGRSPDYHLGFESARALFSELTPARLDLLDTLRRIGSSSIYALAKTADRNYSNVHTDVSRLLELGLIERAEDGMVFVPFEAVEIHFPLAQVS